MNKKVVFGIVGAVALIVIAWAGYQFLALQRAAVEWEGPLKEIASEKMEKTGDTWHIEFQTIFDAPVARVYEAYTHPERARELAPERVVASELKSSSGNKKVVEIRGRVLNLPIQRLVIEYSFYPDERRITSRTLDYNMADISSEYRFQASPDGAKTLLRFTQTSKEKLGNPLPTSVQKGALKESYVTTVRTVNKALAMAKTS
jgi:uncharacterized protein YndB with AHSA1/START domain